MILWKPRSVGLSWKAGGNPPLQPLRLLRESGHFAQELAEQGYLAVLAGQCTQILDLDPAPGQIQEARYVGILDQRLANIVDPLAKVFAVGVRQETGEPVGQWARRQVKQLARWVTPDGVELGLDEYPWVLPQRPAHNLLATTDGNLRWHDAETLARWLAELWLPIHGPRMLAGSYPPAKRRHMRAG